MFDVLGFSERVGRNGDGLDRYIQTVLNVTAPFEIQLKQLGAILFSDTVFVYTFDDEPNSFEDILTVSSRLLHAFIVSGLPVRGDLAW